MRKPHSRSVLLKSFLVWPWVVIVPLVSTSLLAEDNPVSSLPSTTDTAPKPQKSVEIQGTQEVSPEVKKILDTELVPAKIAINGARAIPFEEVGTYFNGFVNKKIKVADLIQACNQVTKLYQDRGFPLSFCFMPAQTFKDGNVQVMVVEGYISSIVITGNPDKTENKIRQIAAPLIEEKPLTKKTLERYTGLLAQIPGLTVQASLPVPKKIDGSTELTLDVSRKAIGLSGRIEALEPTARAIITARASGNTSLAEDVTFSTLLSERDEEYYALGYSMPIGRNGMQLAFDASHYNGNPQDSNNLPGVERDVSSLRLSTTLSYPLMVKRGKNLVGSVGFAATNFDDVSQSSTAKLSQTTDVRAVTAGLNYTTSALGQVRRFQLALSRGLDSLGADKSILLTPTNQQFDSPVKLDFTKTVFSFTQQNVFANGWGVAAMTRVQHSDDILPISERVAFGGLQFGRAFRPGRISGDSGWGVSLELNKLLPYGLQLPIYSFSRIQPFFLLESARTYNESNGRPVDDIGAASLGLRLISDDSSFSNIDFAVSKAIAGRDERIDSSQDYVFTVNFALPLN
ncbi:ShlB/FhaC/HecB family hemolysin secretion/activation protein [Pseudomethylobacillus aquaticus]|uniref:ShlB/FhaC/HecB family hemolysin secretion/activation protein n=1 Tax=Pseudomethylobacillus aquaticus TaxID=2676064 RepID=A0A3N0UUG7_9PROT|nr:ShlB/FhaC/HecB family hemolysin secretion/activation protein [Pseudomethylobacillus aquaticus]